MACYAFTYGYPRALLESESGDDMIQPGKAQRILLTLVLSSLWATGAYGRSSSLRSLTGQTGKTMSFLA